MPHLSIKPNDVPHLRRQLAEFQSLHSALTRLSRDTLELSYTYERLERWLSKQDENCPDLTAKLKAMRYDLKYKSRTLGAVAEQIEEIWDIGMAMQKVFGAQNEFVSPLEFGFPLDVIGAPPTDEELRALQNG